MKYLLFLFSIAVILGSCTRVKTDRNFPALEDDDVTQLTAAQITWLEQLAVQKRDSMRIADSIASLTGVVDTNSLFYKKNMMVAVVEVNNHYFPNVLYFQDSATGKSIFDLAFPFSANLNIDLNTGKPYVSYNDQHKAMIRLGVFDKVRNGGVPVGLSLLGNHDAAGFNNFASVADATEFAQKIAFEVRQKKFAALLTDDEYSQGPSQTPLSNSYVVLMSEIKRLLPDIFLCYYAYGGGSGEYNGKQLGDIVDAEFGAYYPQFNGPVFNAPPGKWFPSCSETAGGFSNVPTTIINAKAAGYRGFMFYNVWKNTSFYAPYAKDLKGITVVSPPGTINSNQYDFINGQ